MATIIKQLFLSLIISCCTLNIYAEKDVTTFLGIPVDGTKEEMYQKLQSKGLVVLDEDTFAIDTINMDTLLNKGYIHEFTYTIKMPLSNYQAIRFANERIYGDVDYYDISEYRHVCGWCIGKDYMYLNYILSAQQTEYIYIIN